jgi:hypothetical protein
MCDYSLEHVALTRLVEGQHATVLQLPAAPGEKEKRITTEIPAETADLAR